MAGMRATMTPYMFFSTDSLPWACGDNETINLLIFISVGKFTIYYFFVLRARIIPITAALPPMMLSRIGR